MKTDLIEIFQTIRARMQPYETLGFVNRINADNEYTLWSEKNVTINGQKLTESYFSGVKIMDDHVCLHLIPTDIRLDNAMVIHADLLSLHSKSSCFIIRSIDDTLIEQISDSLAMGYKIYKQKDWV